MHEAEIKWTPEWYRYIEIGNAVLLIIFLGINFFSATPAVSVIMLFLLLIYFILFIVKQKKAVVKYDRENIYFKWLFSDEKFSLSDIKTICWSTHTSVRYRFRVEHRLYLYFELPDRFLTLSDTIDQSDINACLAGKDENVPLMKLYKFYENEYPQKALGLNEEW
jgi:hypothetical protein